MSNKVIPASHGDQILQPLETFLHHGPHGVQATHIDKVEYNITLHSSDTHAMREFVQELNKFETSYAPDEALQLAMLSHRYYNLFVWNIRKPTQSNLRIKKTRSSSEYLDDDLKNEFSNLDFETLEKIKYLPSIFTTENDIKKKTGDDHLAFIGMITDIEDNIDIDEHYSIDFKLYGAVRQQELNEKGASLGIWQEKWGCLNHSHWEIKAIDLFDELKNLDIEVLPLSAYHKRKPITE
jgi:hypothetical protein